MLCDCCVGVMRGAKWLVRHKMATPAWDLPRPVEVIAQLGISGELKCLQLYDETGIAPALNERGFRSRHRTSRPG
jgi:hypothetical protein